MAFSPRKHTRARQDATKDVIRKCLNLINNIHAKQREFKFYVPDDYDKHDSIQSALLSKGVQTGKISFASSSSQAPGKKVTSSTQTTTHVRKQQPSPMPTDITPHIHVPTEKEKKKIKRRQSILIRKHANEFMESKRERLRRKKRNRRLFHQLQHAVQEKHRKQHGLHRRFSTANFKFELRQSTDGFMQFQEEKKQLKDEHKMCAEEVSYIAKYRLARKMQERARRTTFNDLNLHGSIQMAVENRNKKKLKERGEHAREILHRMEEEKKLKRTIEMERMKETSRVLQTARRLMGKKQIDVAFTDGVIGQASNDKIVNLGFTDGCISDHCRPFNRKSQFVALHFTDGV